MPQQPQQKDHKSQAQAPSPAQEDIAQVTAHGAAHGAASSDLHSAAPRMSIVVIAYNQQSQIKNALNSILNQTSQDFEAIVVDDHSTDSTVSVINETVNDDARVHVIERSENGGAHLARRTGVAATRGEYVLFLDGDDTLDTDAVRRLTAAMDDKKADILRFGLTVVAADSDSAQLAKQVERNLNVSVGRQTGADVLRSVFSHKWSNRATWSVVDCVYRGAMVRDAFAQMADAPLGRLEDAYEFFVLAQCAQSMDFLMDYHGLNYTFGTGISSAGSATAATFGVTLKGTRRTLDAVFDFARITHDPETQECARDFAHYVHDLLADNWSARLSLEDGRQVFPRIRDDWGDAVAGYIAAYAWSKRAVFLDLHAGSLQQVDSDGVLAAWEGNLQACCEAVLQESTQDVTVTGMHNMQEKGSAMEASKDSEASTGLKGESSEACESHSDVSEKARATEMIARGAQSLSARDREWMRAVDKKVEDKRAQDVKLRITQASNRESKRKISQAERANSMKAKVRSKGKGLLLKAVDVARRH